MDESTNGRGRNLAIFVAGTLAGAALSRFLPPIAAQLSGALRTATFKGDVFDDLRADHTLFLHLLDEMIASTSAANRMRLFLKLKRHLSKHALAEEDVIYPLLRDRAGASRAVDQLFHEHAEMKITLARLEDVLADGGDWTGSVTALRDLVARHARDEETTEFPRLRAALDDRQRETMSGKVYREKALLV